ncbi:MAG: hypothetical protein E6G40_12040 [Actinobacteria bacterium]|nr:MAG: hypothetical protein E6G40_12040 [Actinomycetota bacterium]
MRRLAVGAVICLLTTCSGRHAFVPPSNALSERPGTPPRVVGSGLFICPFGYGWEGVGRVVFAPNDAAKPTADVRPDRCFSSLEEATRSGFHLASPPPGGELVGAIYLVPPEPSVLATCRSAADRLGAAVLCPTVVPGAADSMVECGPERCVFFGALALQFTFSGPPGYVGIPGQDGNHLFLLEARAGRERDVEFLTCQGGRRAGSATVRGRAGRWIDCPGGSSMNSGHVMLVWTEGVVRYAVSLHADTPVNRRIALAFADRLGAAHP